MKSLRHPWRMCTQTSYHMLLTCHLILISSAGLEVRPQRDGSMRHNFPLQYFWSIIYGRGSSGDRRILMFLERLSWLGSKAWKTKCVLMGNLRLHYKGCLSLIVFIADNMGIKAFILVVFQNEGLLHGYLFCFVFTEGSIQRWSAYLTDYRQEVQINRIPCLCNFCLLYGISKNRCMSNTKSNLHAEIWRC